MCGRYSRSEEDIKFVTELARMAGRPVTLKFYPRYNITPGSKTAIVFILNDDLITTEIQWGYIPRWSKNGKPDPNYESNNAAIERIETSRMYQAVWKSRRCLIPATGWYEWQRIPGVEKGIPHHIIRRNEKVFWMAGVWDAWKRTPDDPDPKLSFSIITRPAAGDIRDIHDRMPLILPPSQHDNWLDPESRHFRQCADHHLEGGYELYTVSDALSIRGNDSPDCMRPFKRPPVPRQMGLL
jgi:putative SOS response-associated peptidase YedK